MQAGPVAMGIADGGHAADGGLTHRSHGRVRDVVHGGGWVRFSNASWQIAT